MNHVPLHDNVFSVTVHIGGVTQRGHWLKSEGCLRVPYEGVRAAQGEVVRIAGDEFTVVDVDLPRSARDAVYVEYRLKPLSRNP